MNKLSEEVLNNIYKNAHIALQSISDVTKNCDNERMLCELKEEYDGYEKFIGEVSAYMKEAGVIPKEVGAFQKAMMRTSIRLKTAADDSRSHIADMMVKGTVTGLTELYEILSRSDGQVDEKTLRYAEKLKDLEEVYEERLKALL